MSADKGKQQTQAKTRIHFRSSTKKTRIDRHYHKRREANDTMTQKCAYCDKELTTEEIGFHGELLPAEDGEPAIIGYMCKTCVEDKDDIV